MLLRRLGPHIRQQDWFAVVLDVLVVVVGIMVAFQIDRWRENRANRALEMAYVQRLIADVETDIPLIERAIDLAGQRKDFAELLIAAVRDPAAATVKPARFLVAVKEAAFTNTPQLASYTFEDLRSTGNLGLIRDPHIKQALYDYYGFDQHMRQWMQLALAGEQHWFEVVAGVTDDTQENWVADNWRGVAVDKKQEEEVWKMPFDPGPILAAVERLQLRQAAVDWLPGLRTQQVEAMRENEERLALAESLLQQLRDYAARIGATGP